MMMEGEWRQDFELIVKDGEKIEIMWRLQIFFEIKNVSYLVKKSFQSRAI